MPVSDRWGSASPVEDEREAVLARTDAYRYQPPMINGADI